MYGAVGGKLVVGVGGGGGWVGSTECAQQGIFEVWNCGNDMLVNPSGEGFSISGVLVSPSFSKSSKSPSRESFVFVLGSCSSNCRVSGLELWSFVPPLWRFPQWDTFHVCHLYW